jgi:hypothetical protein
MVRKGHAKYMTREMPNDGVNFFPTHPTAIGQLLALEEFPNHILEPCCGDGAISRVLKLAGYRVDSYDLHDHGYGSSGRDFLTYKYKPVSAIITNPPFARNLVEQFIRRALELAAEKVAIFVRLVWIGAAAKRRRLMRELKPNRIIICGRVPMGPKQRGMVDYCWLIWDKKARYKSTQVIWAE